MQGIHKNDLYEALQETKKPLLGICIGMQILFESSQEGNACGLGLLKGKVIRIKLTTYLFLIWDGTESTLIKTHL